jgi:hypothetical protein
MKTTTSRVYLKVSADTNEILAETVATSRQQAMRKLKVDESNLRLYDVIPASKRRDEETL